MSNENQVHENVITTINFNQQLMNMLCLDNESDDEEECLISGEKIELNPIILECNHKFNYSSIFEEIKHQKKLNHLEITKLKRKQMKCPYCRKVQNGLMPWRIGYEKIKYVNWPPSACIKSNNCCHLLKRGKRKGQACGIKSYHTMCKKHTAMLESSIKEQNCVTCDEILKSGKNKGQKCNAKIKSSDTEGIFYKSCKRHIKGAKKLPMANIVIPIISEVQ